MEIERYKKLCEDYLRAKAECERWTKEKGRARAAIEMMHDISGLQQIKPVDGPWSSTSIETEVSIEKGKEEDLIAWLKANQYDGFVKESVSKSSLKELVSTLMDNGQKIPHVNVHERVSLRVYSRGSVPVLGDSDE